MRKLALILLAACGGSHDNHMVVLAPDAAPDADIDAPPPQPLAVELDVFGTPSFIAYRDGDGAWQTPTDDGQGTYTLMATDDYQAVIVCASGGDAQSTLLSATVGDGRQFVFCDVGSGDPPATVTVTGTMQQAGQVYMDDEAESDTPNWNVALDVVPGTHDLYAIDTDHHMLIRRGLDIAAATTLDPIDLTGAASMTPVTLTLGGVGTGDMLYDAIDTFTDNGFLELTSTTTSLYAPPVSLLTGNDFQFIVAEAYSANDYRYAQAQFTGTETAFTLPDPLTGITFGKGSVSWTSLPAMYDGGSLTLDQTTAQGSVEQVVQATGRWLAAKQVTTLAFDVQPPGYDAAWNVDTDTSYSRTFNTGYFDGSTSYGVGIFDGGGGSLRQRAKRPWFSTVERVRASMRSQHTMPRR
jgi:hypothetical protein